MTSFRLQTLLLIAIIVPLGFCSKYYSGPGSHWFNLYGAAVFYEIFWCLCLFLVFPKPQHITVTAVSVFIATCFLEILQLNHHHILESIRSYRVGVWLVGNGFDWLDFPHYVVGSGLGWLVLRRIDSWKKS
jgi:glycopeptide antibiotics resistance protein